MSELVKLVVLLMVLPFQCVWCKNQALIRNVHRGGLHFEGPSWSVEENALYWVDIDGQLILRMDGETGKVENRSIEYGPVSLVVTVKDNPNTLLVTVRSGVYFMPFYGFEGDKSLRLLTVTDIGLPDNRCNDGKVDAKGRLWFGTLDKRFKKDQATLYTIDHENYVNPAIKIRPVTISNGIAWTADRKYMFYIDSPTLNIDVFDFDLEKGSISNRRTLFNFPSNNISGVPDGMTIDSDDNLWVASYGGGVVVKVNSRSGTLLEEHRLPVKQVTSVIWGGCSLSTLYVTTSREGLSPTDLLEQPQAGSLFSIEGTGCRGLPENQFIFPNASNY